ncbi:MAG: hypothetical protein KAY32_13500, partial [Candidatus Eisenbacteria sp.]|nr:hypothetical protein [Candidatus Eisenbacteria bacterium]
MARRVSTNKRGLVFLQVYVADLAERIRMGEQVDESGARLWLETAAGSGRPPGTLPCDEQSLIRLSGLDADRWSALKERLMEGWERDGDRWVIQHVQEQAEQREMYIARAKRGARGRWAGAASSSREAPLEAQQRAMPSHSLSHSSSHSPTNSSSGSAPEEPSLGRPTEVVPILWT